MERADRSAAERSSGRRPVRRSKCTRSGTRHPRRRRSRATILSPPPLWADRPSRCLPREAVHILKQGAAVAISPLHRRLSTTEAGEGRLCGAMDGCNSRRSRAQSCRKTDGRRSYQAPLQNAPRAFSGLGNRGLRRARPGNDVRRNGSPRSRRRLRGRGSDRFRDFPTASLEPFGIT